MFTGHCILVWSRLCDTLNLILFGKAYFGIQIKRKQLILIEFIGALRVIRCHDLDAIKVT